jgi:hypothetical protein
MRCAEFEVLLCDYLDGSLAPAEREAVEAHMSTCAACSELAKDAAAATRFMERAADVEPPPELVTRLLFNAPWKQAAKTQRSGIGSWWSRLLQPVLQPRFVMGMALTILSFSMLGRFVMPNRQIRQADLDPVQIWVALDNRVHRLWDRAVKSYESIRFVYQVQSRLREWEEQRDADQAADSPGSPPQDPRRLPLNNSGKSSEAESRQK